VEDKAKIVERGDEGHRKIVDGKFDVGEGGGVFIISHSGEEHGFGFVGVDGKSPVKAP
jgi:hypothetical protein